MLAHFLLYPLLSVFFLGGILRWAGSRYLAIMALTRHLDTLGYGCSFPV